MNKTFSQKRSNSIKNSRSNSADSNISLKVKTQKRRQIHKRKLTKTEKTYNNLPELTNQLDFHEGLYFNIPSHSLHQLHYHSFAGQKLPEENLQAPQNQSQDYGIQESNGAIQVDLNQESMHSSPQSGEENTDTITTEKLRLLKSQSYLTARIVDYDGRCEKLSTMRKESKGVEFEHEKSQYELQLQTLTKIQLVMKGLESVMDLKYSIKPESNKIQSSSSRAILKSQVTTVSKKHRLSKYSKPVLDNNEACDVEADEDERISLQETVSQAALSKQNDTFAHVQSILLQLYQLLCECQTSINQFQFLSKPAADLHQRMFNEIINYTTELQQKECQIQQIHEKWQSEFAQLSELNQLRSKQVIELETLNQNLHLSLNEQKYLAKKQQNQNDSIKAILQKQKGIEITDVEALTQLVEENSIMREQIRRQSQEILEMRELPDLRQYESVSNLQKEISTQRQRILSLIQQVTANEAEIDKLRLEKRELDSKFKSCQRREALLQQQFDFASDDIEDQQNNGGLIQNSQEIVLENKLDLIEEHVDK